MSTHTPEPRRASLDALFDGDTATQGTDEGTLARPGKASASRARTSRRAMWLAVAVIVAAAVAAVLLWPVLKPGGAPQTPLDVGASITLPDNMDPGLADLPVEDDDTGQYDDPLSLDEYRILNADGSVTYKVPVDGACPVDADGVVGAPRNYRHACHYEHSGAVVYTSHAVRGNRVGAFENIGSLKPGQVIHLDGEKWKVGTVETHPQSALPGYLFQAGNVMLLTCHIDAAVDAGAPFDKTDVVTLERVTN